MNFGLLNKIKFKNKEFPWDVVLFYSASAFLIIAVFTYLIFMFKVSLERQKVMEIDKRIASYGSIEQKAYEAKLVNYKKKIDDFTEILDNHKITANIFALIEANTLPEVSFSNFDMSKSNDRLRLMGRADNPDALSGQIESLEKNSDYIKSINMLNLNADNSTQELSFTIEIFLNPKIFNYSEVFVPLK